MTRPLRALVVEDNPSNRQIMEMILEVLSVDAVSVDDGQKAVAMFEAERFDIVLMDIQMPVMDGLDATRRIREIEAALPQPRTPVLAVTAHALAADGRRALAAGADRHVPKPVRTDRLLEIITEVVTEARACGTRRLAG